MNYEIFNFLTNAVDIATFEDALNGLISGIQPVWLPVGGRDNNAGTIEASSDPGRAIVERITNAIDAVLELEHAQRRGYPAANSPKEAAMSWLGIPIEGLGVQSNAQNQALASKITVYLRSGEDRDSRTIQIRDNGIGISPNNLHKTILSLNESNKISKRYLAGTYGQGGSATFAVSKYTLIASKSYDDNSVGFTIVKFQDLSSEIYKIGNYVYLTNDNEIISYIDTENLFPHGTLVTHYGYKFNSYNSALGPGSLYGLLQQIMFDPTIPFWLDFKLKSEYRRVIKGARNALNSIEPDENDSKVVHKMPMYYINIADFGSIGIEYWALSDAKYVSESGAKRKNPSDSYVDSRKPIVLTLNGQNQAEISSNLIKSDCQLPHLSNRLIVHVDCNRLTPNSKRALFVSNREEVRKGLLLDLIEHEIKNALKNDEKLIEINEEARRKIVESSVKIDDDKIKSEVANILKLQGIDVLDSPLQMSISGKGEKVTPKTSKLPSGIAKEVEIKDPPTYIKFLNSSKRSIKIWRERSYHVRVETDAPSTYFNHDHYESSMISFIGSSKILVRGYTPLRSGKMSVIVELNEDCRVGDLENIRVELRRKNLTTLTDERTIEVVEPPESKQATSKITIPPFKFVSVSGLDDDNWDNLGWSDDITKNSFQYVPDGGIIIIYYSELFPEFSSRLNKINKSDPIKADIFVQQYRIWLAVSSLLMYRDFESESKNKSIDVDKIDEVKMFESNRHAISAALYANRETEYKSRLTEAEAMR